MVSGAVSLGNLVAMTTVPAADAFIIAVPTPLAEGNGADLSYLRSALEAIAPKLRGGELVVLESTSPPGTTDRLGRLPDLELRPDLSASSGPDGTMSTWCALPGTGAAGPDHDRNGHQRPRHRRPHRRGGPAGRSALYEVICQGEILLTDATTAEMTKLVENTYRDVNIAFANELSLICDNLGIDVWELIELANHHPRVNILQPGPGVGGHCIAVDPWFIVDADPGALRPDPHRPRSQRLQAAPRRPAGP